MKNFIPFYDRPNTIEYKTREIGNNYGVEYDYKKSTFSSVSDFADKNLQNLEEDLRKSKINLGYLKQRVLEIDETTKEGLSITTKEIGNKIILFYDNLSEMINTQRCDNLRLQLEINNLTKEKNTMRNELSSAVTAVRKLEVLLGVEKDVGFDSMVTNTIYNQ